MGKLEFWLGVTALGAGIAIYLVDRTPEQLLICQHLPCPTTLPTVALGDSWPSFLHCLAFSLVSLALLAPRSGAGAAAICGYWIALALLLESAQLTESSYLRGTFTAGDVLAVLAGGVVAWLTRWRLALLRRCPHA